MSHRADLVQIGGAGGRTAVPAGEFSHWLRETEMSLRSGTDRVDVPCGDCSACCRSSMFVHIKPEETQTSRRIPRALLFPAPGLPKGHLVMGYDGQGRCPMLAGGRCSIYEDRPQTCRDYDCRIFAATGVRVDPRTQAGIADRAGQWLFTYRSAESREEHAMVRRAAAFLRENEDLFPSGRLPSQSGPLAALAVRICRLFAASAGREKTAIVAAAIAALSAQKHARRVP